MSPQDSQPKAGPRRTLFVERRTYRQRRLIDAARLLPILGWFLLMVPLLWGLGAEVPTSLSILYIFGVWALLIVAVGLLSMRLGEGGDSPSDPVE